VTTGEEGAQSPATEQGLHLGPVPLRHPGERGLILAEAGEGEGMKQPDPAGYIHVMMTMGAALQKPGE